MVQKFLARDGKSFPAVILVPNNMNSILSRFSLSRFSAIQDLLDLGLSAKRESRSSGSVRNIGVYLDPDMSLFNYVSSATCFFTIMELSAVLNITFLHWQK